MTFQGTQESIISRTISDLAVPWSSSQGKSGDSDYSGHPRSGHPGHSWMVTGRHRSWSLLLKHPSGRSLLLPALLLPLKPKLSQNRGRDKPSYTKTLTAHSPLSYQPLHSELPCALDPENPTKELQMPEKGAVLLSLPFSAPMFW